LRGYVLLLQSFHLVCQTRPLAGRQSEQLVECAIVVHRKPLL